MHSWGRLSIQNWCVQKLWKRIISQSFRTSIHDAFRTPDTERQVTRLKTQDHSNFNPPMLSHTETARNINRHEIMSQVTQVMRSWRQASGLEKCFSISQTLNGIAESPKSRFCRPILETSVQVVPAAATNTDVRRTPARWRALILPTGVRQVAKSSSPPTADSDLRFLLLDCWLFEESLLPCTSQVTLSTKMAESWCDPHVRFDYEQNAKRSCSNELYCQFVTMTPEHSRVNKSVKSQHP